jgi:hypothetical protein
MARRITRRRAIQLGTAGTLGYLLTGSAASVNRVYGANEKIRVAGIGIGGKGSGDIDQAGALMEVVAICDIDDNRLNLKAKQWPNAKKYFDYRKLFDEMAKEIDAATISTADHHHAPAAVLAMRAGKHVYVQKPLTHTVFEARLMREEAAKAKVCTQMGNQGSALNGLRRAVELIHAGTLGNIREAHVWTNRRRTTGSRPRTLPRGRRKCRFPTSSTGTSGSGRRRCGPTPPRSRRARRTIRTTGAATGTSAPGRSATWPATPPTWPSAR